MHYELRPALWEDNAFLTELYADVHAGELARLNMPPEALTQLLALRSKAERMSQAVAYPDADHSIVWVGAYRIGRVLLYETETSIQLVDIALLTAFRSEGVGTSILAQLLAYAGERRLPTRLSVGVQSPAKRLFERLGFSALDVDETSVKMERPASI